MSVEENEALRRAIHERRNEELELDRKGVTCGTGEAVRATSEFNDEYPEIARNDRLWAIAETAERLQRSRGDIRHPAQRFREIGEKIRDMTRDPSYQDSLTYGEPLEVAGLIVDERPGASGGNNIQRDRRTEEERHAAALHQMRLARKIN